MRKTVIAAVYPLACGAAQFNDAMVRAMARTSAVDVISWRRMYPPCSTADRALTPRHPARTHQPPRSSSTGTTRARGATRSVASPSSSRRQWSYPWLHPIMAPPYRYILKHAPRSTTRVVICHNVTPHEASPGVRWLTQAVLRHADVLVTHAPHQRDELASLGLDVDADCRGFHPRFSAPSLAPEPSERERSAGACSPREPGSPPPQLRVGTSVQGHRPRARGARPGRSEPPRPAGRRRPLLGKRRRAARSGAAARPQGPRRLS